MSDYDSEVFSSAGKDSDVYSHSNESRHFGTPADYSSDPANSVSSSTGSAPYHHTESDGSINTDHSLESPTEICDSDHSLSIRLLPADSDQSEGPQGVDDQYDSSDADGDEIFAEAPYGLRESHFQLLCEGSEVTLIEGMVLLFQYALK